MKSVSGRLFGSLLVASCAMLVLQPARAETTRIDVSRDGETFIIDAVFVAPVSVREAWAVLTDFDAMSRFVPDLESSRITARVGTRLTVEQRGTARWGPLALRFQTVREVELTPFERVTSHVVSGSLRRVDTLTRFATVAHGTEIRHHIELMTESWLPDFVVEGFLRAEVRQQFEALEREMRRRGSVSGPPP
jgi:hypothetical protein